MAFCWRAIGIASLDDAARQNRRVLRLGDDDPGLRTPGPQHTRDTFQCASGSRASDKVVRRSVAKVTQDLLGGGLAMDLCVRFVLELSRPEPAMGRGKLPRFIDHASSLGGGWRQHDAGTEEAHQPTPFD